VGPGSGNQMSTCSICMSSMSAAGVVNLVVNVINPIIDVSCCAIVAPKACLEAYIFEMFIWSLHPLVVCAHVMNLYMQATELPFDALRAL